MFAKTVTEAARFVVERGVIKEGAPILLKFVTQVAARFGLVVTQKVAAQAVFTENSIRRRRSKQTA
jgi:hypothetical protein